MADEGEGYRDPRSAPSDGPTVGELARRVAEALSRIESIATRFETQFVRRDIFDLTIESFRTEAKIARDGFKQTLDELDRKIKMSEEVLDKRISKLEDDKVWLSRLIYGFLITTVLGALIAGSQVLGK